MAAHGPEASHRPGAALERSGTHRGIADALHGTNCPRLSQVAAAVGAGHRMSDVLQQPGQRRRHEGFPSAVLGNQRTLTVALPPGYDEDASQRYPVLYVHDGQNLFDPAEAAYGMAWLADATAARLAAARR